MSFTRPAHTGEAMMKCGTISSAPRITPQMRLEYLHKQRPVSQQAT
jgi:hypothetical protein